MPVISVEGVLEFWFGQLDEHGCVAPEYERLWFDGSVADEPIRQRFSGAVHQALAGELDHWADSPRGRLALVILLDQFTRNLYRGQPEAFSGDAQAMVLARDGFARGDDKQLPLMMRRFMYLPLEHSEDIADQHDCVAKMQAMVAEAPDALLASCKDSVHWAEVHRDIVLRFGRFPHRNPILGRSPTDEEIAWLEDGGNRFGQ